MTPERFVRRAGHGTLPDGSRVTWTISEGRRGRRWREVRSDESGVRISLLLETDAERRFSHAELSTAAGLLTLHPEADGTLHGNVVSDAGVRHVAGLAWQPDGLLLVDGSPTAAAAAAYSAADQPSGTTRRGHIVVVDRALGLEIASNGDVERIDDRRFVFGGRFPATIDPDGLPLLDGAETWPLEVEKA